MSLKVHFRSVQEECGALCVMITGDHWMLKWFVDSWDTQQMVREGVKIKSFTDTSCFSGALAFSTAYFGKGAGPILDNVHCNGIESSLLDCNHLNQSNCAHNADAGVRCKGK